MTTIQIGEFASVVALPDGSVVVTRPCVMGGVASHHIDSIYTPKQIATWLMGRLMRRHQPMIQDLFSGMKSEDREFLMSGITPDHWNKMFPKEEEA